MKVLLMRHGKTAGNLQRRYIGRTDEPLCPEGIAHLRATGADPSVRRVYVSPLRRCRETAAIKFPNAEQIVIPGLREMDFGDFEGRCADEMAQDADYRAWLEGNCMGPCPNGESGEGFIRRVASCFDELARACIERGEEDLIIVAHGGTAMSVLWSFAQEKREYYEWGLGNGCYYQAEIEDLTWCTNPVLKNVTLHEIISKKA